MSKLSDKISEIFGFRLKEGEWEKYLVEMDKEGEPTRKNMAAMLFAIGEDVEELRKEMNEKIINAKYFVEKTLPEGAGVVLKEGNVPRTAKGRNTHKTV